MKWGVWGRTARGGFSARCHLYDTFVTSLATSTETFTRPDGGTCGGCAKDHRLGLCHAQVPDSIAVAHVLLEQLAKGPGACGGLEAGHNLDMGGVRGGVRYRVIFFYRKKETIDSHPSNLLASFYPLCII